MSALLVSVVILLGIILIILEVFVIPGGIVGLFGIAVAAVGISLAYTHLGTAWGNSFTIGSVMLTMLLLVYGLKSGVWKKLSQQGVIDSRMNEVNTAQVKPGATGISLSALRPTGTGLFNDEKVEVHSEGEIIPANVNIEIIKIEDNRIIVKPIKSE